MTHNTDFHTVMGRLSRSDYQTISKRISDRFQDQLKQLHIDEDLSSQLGDIYVPLAASLFELTKQRNRPVVVGVNGAQGSGKSTLCTLLEAILQECFASKVARFSLDDIYCTRAERLVASRTIHPLLATRGVPGTHDVELGHKLLDQLTQQQPGLEVSIPVFDKTMDDRAPQENWRKALTPFDLILFEGWCVGVKPAEESTLAAPINTLEANEDPSGIWRSHINRQLCSTYAELFARIDLLIMLQVPSMECVLEWRGLQERKLAKLKTNTSATQIMDMSTLHRFIMHFERLTRQMQMEMPNQADIVLHLNCDHQIESIHAKPDRLAAWGHQKE